jgi:hypothetical protein
MLQRLFVRQIRALGFAQACLRFLVLFFRGLAFQAQTTLFRVNLFCMFLVKIFAFFLAVLLVESLFFLRFLLVEIRSARQRVGIGTGLNFFVFCLHQPRRQRRELFIAQPGRLTTQRFARNLFTMLLRRNRFRFCGIGQPFLRSRFRTARFTRGFVVC